MDSRHILQKKLHWDISQNIRDDQCDQLFLAISAINDWIGTTSAKTNRIEMMGGLKVLQSPWIWQKLGFHHVELSTIFIEPNKLSLETAVHEMAHILDNLLGPHPLASIFGGGPSDAMVRYLGIEPEQFFPRFHAPGYENLLRKHQIELNPTPYGRSYGPAEDFAEAFKLAVLQPEQLDLAAPKRAKWLKDWKYGLFSELPLTNQVNTN